MRSLRIDADTVVKEDWSEEGCEKSGAGKNLKSPSRGGCVRVNVSGIMSIACGGRKHPMRRCTAGVYERRMFLGGVCVRCGKISPQFSDCGAPQRRRSLLVRWLRFQFIFKYSFFTTMRACLRGREAQRQENIHQKKQPFRTETITIPNHSLPHRCTPIARYSLQ